MASPPSFSYSLSSSSYFMPLWLFRPASENVMALGFNTRRPRFFPDRFLPLGANEGPGDPIGSSALLLFLRESLVEPLLGGFFKLELPEEDPPAEPLAQDICWFDY